MFCFDRISYHLANNVMGSVCTLSESNLWGIVLNVSLEFATIIETRTFGLYFNLSLVEEITIHKIIISELRSVNKKPRSNKASNFFGKWKRLEIGKLVLEALSKGV